MKRNENLENSPVKFPWENLEFEISEEPSRVLYRLVAIETRWQLQVLLRQVNHRYEQ